MRWDRGRSTPDVIDQRGSGGGGRRVGGGLPIGRAGGGLGLVGILVVVAIRLLGGGGGTGGFPVDQPFGAAPGDPAGGQPIPAAQDSDRDLRDFSAYVFTFYQDMTRQLKASGDFAWAYVIAHEMGHHVQRQLGIAERVDALRRKDPDSANELSVRQELQADCYSGVWAHQVFKAGQLEDGDIDEAFTAAEAVGDDRLQRDAGREVDRDSFTHGSSEQRRRWFDEGRRDGDPAACDTFAAESV